MPFDPPEFVKQTDYHAAYLLFSKITLKTFIQMILSTQIPMLAALAALVPSILAAECSFTLSSTSTQVYLYPCFTVLLFLTALSNYTLSRISSAGVITPTPAMHRSTTAMVKQRVSQTPATKSTATAATHQSSRILFGM